MSSLPIQAVATTLQQAGISFAVIGGHAVNYWLEPRFTGDIDLTVIANQSDQQRLLQLMQAANFSLDKEIGSDQASGPDFLRFVSKDQSIVVEIQIAKTVLQTEVVKRAVGGDHGLRTATPEDLIILKLIANRPKDQIDLLGLIKLENLDWEYINNWCRQWGLEENLQKLLTHK